MTLLKELIGRTHAHAREEREVITTALGIADTVKEKAAAIKSDGRLSKTGQAAKLVEMVTGNLWAHLQQLRAKADTLRADIEKARSRMTPKQPDPSDLVGALDRRELRDILKAATRGERLRLARDDDRFAEAVLLAPHPLTTDVSDEPAAPGQPSDLEIIRTAYQRRNFAELYAGIELREQNMQAVDSALRRATEQICAEAGIGESEIARLLSKDVEVDPDNLPKITRADLNTWSATDPGRAAAEMQKVYAGKAELVE